jgi:hypothetical protein
MQKRHNHRLRAPLLVLVACYFLVACGGHEEVVAPSSTEVAGAADNDSSSIVALYASEGGDLAVLQGTDTAATDVAEAAAADQAGRQQILAGGKAVLPSDNYSWANITDPFGTPSEVLPMNVPGGYDWARSSVLHRGNAVPAGFKAMTGWGQVLSARDAANAATQGVEIRNHQTLLCTRVNGVLRWIEAQDGDLAGAVFRADFAGNVASPASVTKLGAGYSRIFFEKGRAYHFWPKQGRVDLPAGAYCGMVVVAEARAVLPNGSPLPSGVQPSMVFSLGADYWTTRTAAWSNFKTNKSAAIGQLRRVTGQWQWHGFSTASSADVQRLRATGTQ